MNDFLKNIFRYPRFVISSLIGLILVILSPFKSLFKIPKFRIILIILILILMLLISTILQKMVGL